MAKLRAAKQGKALDSDHDAEGSDEPKQHKIKMKAKRAISSNDEGSPAEEIEVATSETPQELKDDGNPPSLNDEVTAATKTTKVRS